MNAQIGFFPGFKGSDVVLVGVTHESLSNLIESLEPLSRSTNRRVLLSALPFVESISVNLAAESAASDEGLRVGNGGAFTWTRSESGWAQVLAQLRALEGTNCGHQYLDGPTETTVVVVSIGEYPHHFWHVRG